jgi:hypothetical protein
MIGAGDYLPGYGPAEPGAFHGFLPRSADLIGGTPDEPARLCASDR